MIHLSSRFKIHIILSIISCRNIPDETLEFQSRRYMTDNLILYNNGTKELGKAAFLVYRGTF